MNLYVATHHLLLHTTSNKIQLSPLASASYSKPLGNVEHKWEVLYLLASATEQASTIKADFQGSSYDEQLIPYNWSISQKENGISLSVDFINDALLHATRAEIDYSKKRINITLYPKNEKAPINIDPLFHPLGSLLMVYLAHSSNGFLIHASGVYAQDKGHLFSAVSGTGKSTMASLWQKSGAKVINDDRLWIEKTDDQWWMYNTPMIWYAQEPRKSPVHNVFLLSQAPENELTPISGLRASMQVMSNCIQHLYHKDMTQQHLETLIQFSKAVNIYRCAFKPDQGIVQLIQKL